MKLFEFNLIFIKKQREVGLSVSTKCFLRPQLFYILCLVSVSYIYVTHTHPDKQNVTFDFRNLNFCEQTVSKGISSKVKFHQEKKSIKKSKPLLINNKTSRSTFDIFQQMLLTVIKTIEYRSNNHKNLQNLIPQKSHSALETDLVTAYSLRPLWRFIGEKVPIQPRSRRSRPTFQVTNRGLKKVHI